MSSRNDRTVALREFKGAMDARQGEFANALPAHIPVARFVRVVLTAVQNNNQLLDAPPRQLFNACVKAAQDGLLPDGREGALVVRPSKNGLSVTWQPMIAGIRKKVRNSGEIATWDVQAVFEKDHFEYELGDEPFIRHKPALGDRGPLIAVYSIATLKSGEKTRDVMSISDVHKIRDRSDAYRAFKAKKIRSTPWDTDEAEMAKKTVARRHSKVLPMSTDLDDLLRRDDALYNFDGASDGAPEATPTRRSIAAKLDALAGPDDDGGDDDDDESVVIDGKTGEVLEDGSDGARQEDRRDEKPAARGHSRADAEAGDAPGRKSKRAEPAKKAEAEDRSGGGDDDLQERADAILDRLGFRPTGIDPDDPEQVIAFSQGMEAFETGIARRAVPGEYRAEDKSALAAAWQRGHDASAAEASASRGEGDDGEEGDD